MSIDIAKFEEVLPDPEAIRGAMGKLKGTAESVETAASDSAASWAKLNNPAVYKAPGQEIVFGAFQPVTTAADDLVTDIGTVGTAVGNYADAVQGLKDRLVQVKADYAAFQSAIAGRSRDDWDDDEGLVGQEQGIIGALDQLYADLQSAQRDCANSISGIYGGPKYVLTTEEGPKAGEIAYGYTKEQLDAAAVEGHVPWGQPTEWDKPWYKDVVDGVVSFGKGFWSGITGTVTGLGNMLGFGGWETFKATWTGLGKLAVNVAIVTSPAAQVVLRATGNGHIADKAGEELLAVGKAAIHWDDWQRDPAYAAGATTFDLASILLTAGGGAVAKTGSVAGKITTVANAGGKAATVLNATGIAKAASFSGKIIDLGQALKINTVNIAANTGRTVIGKVGNVVDNANNYLINAGRNAADNLAALGDNLFPQPAMAGVPGGGSSAGGNRMAAMAFTPEGPSSRPGGTASGTPAASAPDTSLPDTSVPAARPGTGTTADAPVGRTAPAGTTPAQAPAGRPAAAAPDAEATPRGWQANHPGEAPDDYAHRGDNSGDPLKDPNDIPGSGAEPDPDYGRPREDAGAFEPKHDLPDSRNEATDNLRLDQDPEHRFGRDENGNWLDEEGYASRYVQEDGSFRYPSNAGGVEGSFVSYDDPQRFIEDHGAQLDRIGHDYGAYLAREGTPWEMRALPLDTLGSDKNLRHFEINPNGTLPEGYRIEVSEIDSGFGQPGGGTQVRILDANGEAVSPHRLLNEMDESGRPLHGDFFREAPRTIGKSDPLYPRDPKAPFASMEVDGKIVPRALEPNSRYFIEGRGTFHTNDHGEIYQVEAESGRKRMPASAEAPAQKATWNPELNTPSPNMTYLVDGNLTFRTDHLGRTTSLRAEDIQFHEKSEADARRHGSNQSASGKLGGSNFDGGHLLAAMFGGPGEKLNLVPQLNIQNRNFGLGDLTPGQRARQTGNDKTWYDLETEVRSILNGSGGTPPKVTWEARPVYSSDGPVPDLIDLRIQIGNRKLEYSFDN